MEQKTKILLIESSQAYHRVVEYLLKDTFHLYTAKNLKQSHTLIKSLDPDLIILGLKLDDSEGIPTFIQLHKSFPNLAIIILAENTNDELALECLKLGAQDYLVRGQMDSQILTRSILYSIERKRVEAELINAKLAAEAASRAKSNFLDNISHELRTPLNGILGMASLLEISQLQPEQKKKLNSLQSSAKELNVLIGEILKFSQIDFSKVQTKRKKLNLKSLLQKIAEKTEKECLSKNLTFYHQISPEIPDLVYGDSTKIQEIFQKLFNNSIKFTPSGGKIFFKTQKAKQSYHVFLLHIQIKDTGIGIPKEQCEKIFQAFHQGDNSNTRQYGGLGLGLTIASRYVTMLGGKIWLESKEQEGTTIHITLPLQEPDNLDKNQKVNQKVKTLHKEGKTENLLARPTNE